ncbi:MAG: tRNA lysidine(34) synthetase TilS [Planctomycetes bacterium]|nr:tRNA lysidine(34) synthetase TilS [Planctomycetota bacterium]
MVVGLVGGNVNIVKKVYLTIEGYDLIRPGETVICAISGGPDSICMLLLLDEINKTENFHLDIHAVYVHHGLRPQEADEEAKFVKKFCKDLGIKYSQINLKLDVEGKGKTSTLEESARKARYAALKEFAITKGAEKILLGHTFDDQAETILFRIIRGTGLRGLKGIPPIRMLSKKHDLFVARPLIEVERKEVIQYLTEKKVDFKIDSSNMDIRIKRNLIRNEIIPLIEKTLNPKIKQSLVKLGQISRSFYICIKEIAKEMYENVKLMSKEGEICISSQEFAKFPPSIQTLIIDFAIQNLLKKLPQLDFEHYFNIIGLTSNYGHGKIIQLPADLLVKRESYVLKFYKTPKEVEKPNFTKKKLQIPGVTDCKKLNLIINSEVKKGKLVGFKEYLLEKDFTEEVFDQDKINEPLFIRLRQPGDSFKPLGGPGRCKLKDFFIDQKIPKEYRDQIPVIVDKNDNIVWVVGYRISDDSKVTESSSKILRMKFTRTV